MGLMAVRIRFHIKSLPLRRGVYTSAQIASGPYDGIKRKVFKEP